MKYEYTSQMREISGFGGNYEGTCRKMVIADMEWYDENPGADVRFAQYSNITGITTDENEDCKKLQEAMHKVTGEFGCTGAMMQACLSHVMFAHRNGWDRYVHEMSIKTDGE